jgi:ABC-type transport system involved in multi-copper enzyme maturation permease subunit
MTTTIAARTSTAGGPPSALLRPIPFRRLLRVEWAKATDTRSSRWLLALVAVSTIGLMLAPVLAPSSIEQSYTSYLTFAAAALGLLLPVVAILMLTSEWSQRTVFTTFTQEPRRMRVIKAKLAASLLLGGGAAVYGGLVTAAGLGVAAASGRTVEANLTAGAVAGFVLCALLNVGFGLALGALLQSSATAIAASFVLPAATGLLAVASKPVGQWLDSSTAFNWVLENQWEGHLPQIVFSVILWVAAPLAVGIVRTLRRDVT